MPLADMERRLPGVEVPMASQPVPVLAVFVLQAGINKLVVVPFQMERLLMVDEAP